MLNPSLPFPNQNFPNFLPPDPNPNPNFSQSESQDLPLDLSSSISSLKNLIHAANQTIQSLSFLGLTPNPSDNGGDSDFVQCAFDRRHRLPPHSLFRHSLLCPSAPHPRIDPTHLLHSSLYPHSLQSSRDLIHEKRFNQALPDSDADLCFSLNDYADSSSNFFYVDCPAVVTLCNQDEMSKVFTLPRILAVECANFVGEDDRGMESARKEVRILPSDLWALRNEVEMWNDYPSMYSHVVLRSILGSKLHMDGHLMTWVIANSPRYGVVIDVAMRDHLFLLFRLCFMAILKEALGFQIALENGNEMSCSFKCPVLIQVLMWLGSQLSVLYGETSGKLFAIHMFRQCMLDSASSLLLLPLEQKPGHDQECSCSDTENVKLRKSVQKVRNDDNATGEESVTCTLIFVSQVAAAIAALHERFLLEEKIKALRFSHLQTKYQLVSEHNYISQRASEERKRRCNYRPIIEHDGLPKQQANDEGTGKTKTREELLAEERDYKRRRMSYRGKKAKRSTLQVTRHIIEEYMDEIMKAGGIGCFVKGTEERGVKNEHPTEHNIARDIVADEYTKGSNDSYRAVRHSSSHSKKQSNYYDRYPASDKPQKGHYGHYGSLEDERKSVSKDKYDQDHYYRSSDRSSSPSQSRKRNRYLSDRDDEVPVKTRHHETRKLSSSSSNFHGFRSPSSSRSGGGSSARKDGRKSKAGDNWKRSMADNHVSKSSTCNSFNDRYTPSEWHDQLEDDYSTGSRYVNPDEL